MFAPLTPQPKWMPPGQCPASPPARGRESLGPALLLRRWPHLKLASHHVVRARLRRDPSLRESEGPPELRRQALAAQSADVRRASWHAGSPTSPARPTFPLHRPLPWLSLTRHRRPPSFGSAATSSACHSVETGRTACRSSTDNKPVVLGAWLARGRGG